MRSEEDQIRDALSVVLDNPAYADNPLLAEYRVLADKYLRLQRKFTKITKISDQVHVQLRELNQRVEERTADLVEAKKMAALGTLVAGVAHEINTPVGTALTVASTLRRRAQDFGKAVESGVLKRSVLNGFSADAAEATSLLLGNLERAGELIGSFKQVAVDRTSSAIRPFAVRAYVDEVMASLRPHMRRPPVDLVIDIPDMLEMVSSPGAFGQILTNLVLNAMTHGFAERERGRITLTGAKHGRDKIKLTFADDGNGMDDDTARRAFDPFFTTRRGQGGSGLGLHILFNLTTQTLGGTVSLETSPGQGTAFELILPLVAPSARTPGEATRALAGEAGR